MRRVIVYYNYHALFDLVRQNNKETEFRAVYGIE